MVTEMKMSFSSMSNLPEASESAPAEKKCLRKCGKFDQGAEIA